LVYQSRSTYIEDDGRGYMYSYKAIRLHHDLHIISDLVSDIQRTVRARFVSDFKQLVHRCLIDTNGSRDFGKTLVGCVAGFIDDVDIEEIGLNLEQSC